MGEHHNPRQLARLERRIARYLAKMEKVKNYELAKSSVDGEEIREWLEAKCKGLGVGLDVCCGYFPITEDAIGVDSDISVVGTDYAIVADALTPVRDTELDYVVTNYFDAFSNPVSVLQEWSRVLKSGGLLAISCANADMYDNLDGPLSNRRRSMAYTEKTISQLIYRCGFLDVKVEKHKKNLMVTARKV